MQTTLEHLYDIEIMPRRRFIRHPPLEIDLFRIGLLPIQPVTPNPKSVYYQVQRLPVETLDLSPFIKISNKREKWQIHLPVSPDFPVCFPRVDTHGSQNGL